MIQSSLSLTKQLERDYPTFADKNWGNTPTADHIEQWLSECEYVDSPIEDGEYIYLLTVHRNELGIIANPNKGAQAVKAAIRAIAARKFPRPAIGKILPSNSAVVAIAMRFADTVVLIDEGYYLAYFSEEI